jgi:hypothetical protein
MTYTFKLARRLAVSRIFSMLPVLLVFAACSGGDATAPDNSPAESPTAGTEWRPRDITPVTVRVNPSRVTLETNQLIHFRAHGRNSAGDSVGAAVTWSTTGGTILPDGRFSAAAIGTFAVIGTNRVRGEVQVDTSLVVVVRRPLNLSAIEVSPSSTSLTPGVSQTFAAIGRNSSGSVVPIGVNWSSTGGTIDAGGTYVAGDTAGTYRVVATNTAGTLADTATITITAPPAPPPPPPPAPTLQSVTLVPSKVTLATGTTKQFAAYGQTTSGDSIAVSVKFAATGGTVTTGGLYTAGPSAGTFRVIATVGTLADTSAITVTVPLGSGGVSGIPFGPFATWDSLTIKPNTELFNLSHTGYTPDLILARIDIARAAGVAQLPAMTGGARANYLTDGVFDMAKWKARMDRYNTSAIKAAVAAAVADGTIIGNSVMDEPFNTGGPGNEGNSWGPAGTMTKARVDSLCAYVKTIFPTLPTGVFHDHRDFEPTKSYKVCDFIIAQYRSQKGSVQEFRDGALALGQRDGHAIAFSLNILDGGIQAVRDGLWNCPLTTTGGRGTYNPNCRMTADQVRNYGIVLGSAGCALTMWRYDSGFMADAANKAAFKDVADRLATLPPKSCRRP